MALLKQQQALEDMFTLDADAADIKNDKLAKKTDRILKRRRRIINRCKSDLAITDSEHKKGQRLYELCKHYFFGL